MGPKDNTEPEIETKPLPYNNGDDEVVTIKKSKEHPKTERVYRKRKSSVQDASDEEDETTRVDKSTIAKKAHLQSNLDADSDFSIDSDSEEEKNDNDPVNIQHQATDVPSKNENQLPNVTTEAQVQLENVTKDQSKDEKTRSSETENKGQDDEEEVIKSDPKIDKKKIWEKRTVGDVLVGAIQRYFERKQQREG